MVDQVGAQARGNRDRALAPLALGANLSLLVVPAMLDPDDVGLEVDVLGP